MLNATTFGAQVKYKMDDRLMPRRSSHLDYPDDVQWVITSQTTDETKIRLGLKSKEEFQSWLTHYQNKSGYIYRVLRHRKSDGKYSVFKATYRCQHNTVPSHHKAKKPSTKHTNCPAKIEVTIKAIHKRSRGVDDYMPNYPAVVRLIANHNHRSNTLEALKYRDVPEIIRNKFLELFKAGHSPAQALKLHKKDLMLECGDSYKESLTNRAVCPDSKWVYYVYNRYFKKGHNHPLSLENDMLQLEREVEHLQSQGFRLVMENSKDKIHYIVMCTPLMERVHHLETSGHVAFIDGSGNVDRCNCYVYLIMVDSCLGGLPVGALILANPSEETFSAALKTYCTLMPPNAFGGKGECGPTMILSDEMKTQGVAIRECFSNSLILYCPSTAFQHGWRWLWNPKHNVAPFDRRELYLLYTYLFSCSTEAEFQTFYDRMITSDLVQKYPKFVKYLSELRVKTDIWLTSCSAKFDSLEGATKHLTEISIRVLKDKILDKTKSYSVSQVLQYLTTDLTKHYKTKIMCAVNGSSDAIFYNQYCLRKSDLSLYEINKLNEYLYEVKRLDNPEDSCQVSIACGMCECPLGMLSTCFHQQLVAAKEDVAATNIIPVDVESKRHLHWLASGEHDFVENESSDETSIKDEMTSITVDPFVLQVAVSQLEDDKQAEQSKMFPKHEIQQIGQEFIETVLKCYEPNPKELTLAMRKFQTCFQQHCTNHSDTLTFLNSFSAIEDVSEDTVNKLVASEHDYSSI